jgi:hypothetical protein
LHGNEAEFYHVLVSRHGLQAVNELMRLKRTTAHHTRADLIAMIERFK